MVKEEQEQHHSSANDSENSGNSSAKEDQENPENVSTTTPTKCTDYELQREARIADNKARMEALGLRNIANSLMGTPQNRRITRSCTPKSKRGVVKKEDDDDDDEYEPNDEFVDGDNDDDSEEEEETFVPRNRKSSAKEVKSTKLKSGKQVSKRNTEIPVFMDEDEALKQAIALSLKDHEENSDLQKGGFSQGSNTETPGTSKDKCHYQFQEDRTKRRKRKLFTSRVKMTEDDLVIHFCQIDGSEAGKGGIKLRDVVRMAASHDYNWTDKELSDMIRCFDSDRDGKLTLDDFRNIVQRCNMLLVQDDS